MLPSIAIASLLTYFIFSVFDHSNTFPNSHHLINFIPSLTFIKPNLLNYFICSSDIRFDYINSSYWSLWPEIQFYVLSSVLYYVRKEKFIRNFIIISFLLIAINYIFQNIQGGNKINIDLPAFLLRAYSKWIQNGFTLLIYLPFFSIGVLFYSLFKNRQNNFKTSFYVKFGLGTLLLYSFYSGIHFPVRLIYHAMFFLFFCFIYIPEKLIIFENKILTNIGESSYFLYLIHENIGMLLIYSFGVYFLRFGFIFTLSVILILIVLSHFYTVNIDKRINKWLKKKTITTSSTSIYSI